MIKVGSVRTPRRMVNFRGWACREGWKALGEEVTLELRLPRGGRLSRLAGVDEETEGMPQRRL